MRRRSPINRDKRLSLLETARHMTPEERLTACVNLSRELVEVERAGRRHREKQRERNRRP